MTKISFVACLMACLLHLSVSQGPTRPPTPPPSEGCIGYEWMCFGQNPGLPGSMYTGRMKGPFSYVDNQDGTALAGKSLQIEYRATEVGVPVRFMLLAPFEDESPQRTYTIYYATTHIAKKIGFQEVVMKVNVFPNTRIAFEVTTEDTVPIGYEVLPANVKEEYHSYSGYRDISNFLIRFPGPNMHLKFQFRLCMFAGFASIECKVMPTPPALITVNECNIDNGGCEHVCVDTPDSFYCDCPEHFALDNTGKKCISCTVTLVHCFGQHPGLDKFSRYDVPWRTGKTGLFYVDNQDAVVTIPGSAISIEYFAAHAGDKVEFVLAIPNDGEHPDDPQKYTIIHDIHHTANYTGYNEIVFEDKIKVGSRIGVLLQGHKSVVPFEDLHYSYHAFIAKREGNALMVTADGRNRHYQFRMCIKAGVVPGPCPSFQQFIQVDECEGKYNGGCSQVCHDLEGINTLECGCHEGYRLYEDGVSCTDLDECTLQTHQCEHTCLNVVGSYECECHKGYVIDIDRVTCLDINECLVNNGGCDQECHNTVGSYYCICKSDYIRSIDGHTCQYFPTVNIDNFPAFNSKSLKLRQQAMNG